MAVTISTIRFVLNTIKAADQSFVFLGLSNKQVTEFYGVSYTSIKATAAQMAFYKEVEENKNGLFWKITDKAATAKMGVIGYFNH